MSTHAHVHARLLTHTCETAQSFYGPKERHAHTIDIINEDVSASQNRTDIKDKKDWNVYGFSEAYGLWKESVLKESVLGKDEALQNDLQFLDFQASKGFWKHIFTTIHGYFVLLYSIWLGLNLFYFYPVSEIKLCHLRHFGGFLICQSMFSLQLVELSR